MIRIARSGPTAAGGQSIHRRRLDWVRSLSRATMPMKPLYAGLITAAAIVGAILICVGCRRCQCAIIKVQFARHRRDLLARRSVLPDPRLRRWESKTIHPRHHGRGERARRRAILPRPDVRPGGQGVLGSVVIVTSKNLLTPRTSAAPARAPRQSMKAAPAPAPLATPRPAARP